VPKEKSEEDKQHDEFMECLKKGISTCRKAPIDESHVIKTGRHKNHGPRFCSKCKRCVFMV
jgi:hypothetical protein